MKTKLNNSVKKMKHLKKIQTKKNIKSVKKTFVKKSKKSKKLKKVNKNKVIYAIGGAKDYTIQSVNCDPETNGSVLCHVKFGVTNNGNGTPPPPPGNPPPPPGAPPPGAPSGTPPPPPLLSNNNETKLFGNYFKYTDFQTILDLLKCSKTIISLDFNVKIESNTILFKFKYLLSFLFKEFKNLLKSQISDTNFNKNFDKNEQDILSTQYPDKLFEIIAKIYDSIVIFYKKNPSIIIAKEIDNKLYTVQIKILILLMTLDILLNNSALENIIRVHYNPNFETWKSQDELKIYIYFFESVSYKIQRCPLKPEPRPRLQSQPEPLPLPEPQPQTLLPRLPRRRLQSQPEPQPLPIQSLELDVFSGQPLGQPTGQPSGQPSGQPLGQPSGQPLGPPTRQPTRQPKDLFPIIMSFNSEELKEACKSLIQLQNTDDKFEKNKEGRIISRNDDYKTYLRKILNIIENRFQLLLNRDPDIILDDEGSLSGQFDEFKKKRRRFLDSKESSNQKEHKNFFQKTKLNDSFELINLLYNVDSTDSEDSLSQMKELVVIDELNDLKKFFIQIIKELYNIE